MVRWRWRTHETDTLAKNMENLVQILNDKKKMKIFKIKYQSFKQ